MEQTPISEVQALRPRSPDARDLFGRALKLDYNLFAAHAGLARALCSDGELATAAREHLNKLRPKG